MKRNAKQVLTELLVLKAQGGDEQAFTDLYGLWASDLARIAKARLGGNDGAEEAAQDAWVAIARGLRKLEDPSRFLAWAIQILNRRCVDWIRKRQLDRRRQDALGERQDADRLANGLSQDSDQRVALQEAVAQLDAESRQLLHLFYQMGMGVDEIGAALEVPAGTVKSRLFKLRENLKTIIERK